MADGAHRPESVHVTYRRMQFDFEQTGFPKYWHDGSPFLSFFWDAMSTAFPPGEKFFIDSARALRSRIDDPAMLEEIADFCRQEGHHTYHHLKFNRMVGEQGFDVARLEGRFARTLDRVREQASPEEMLAITMALEHFTAGFAREYLTNPNVTRGVDPNVHALWAWHAAEEAEHKATCYDIYQRISGDYFRRIAVMPAAWFLLLAITVVNTFDLLKQDGKPTDWRDLWRGARYLFGFRGLVTRMLPSFFAYFSPWYHPWRDDDSQLITRWMSSNARYIQALGKQASAVAAE